MTDSLVITSQINTLIQMIALAVCVIMLAIRQHRKRINVQLIFVMCAFGCYFASDIYWVSFISMTSYENMPGLTPVELGELGAILFLISALRIEAGRKYDAPFVKHGILTLFCLVNAGCWFYWRGSLINTLTSLLGMLPLCVIAASDIDSMKIVSRKSTVINYIGFILIVICEVPLLFTTGPIIKITDMFCDCLWMAGWIALIYLWIRTIYRSSKTRNTGSEAFTLTVNMFCMSLFSLYATAGFMYSFSDSMMTVTCILMTVSLVRREYLYDLL